MRNWGAVILLTLAAPLGAQSRHALVIGNDTYQSVNALKNARNDARAMGTALEGLGFRVTRVFDAGLEQIDRSIEAFAASLKPGDAGLLFYAGHGTQSGGLNYMIPVDFKGADDTAVKHRCYSLEQARDRVAQSGARLNVLIFDACRTYPRQAASRLFFYDGLAPMEAGLGTLIAYSAGPGQAAADSPGQSNSLFTGELLKALREPVDLLTALRRVREAVYIGSGGKQRPWIHEDLIQEVFFGQAPRPSRPEVPLRASQGDPLIEGNTLLAQGKHEEALKLFERARRADPENPYAHNAAGAAYGKLGLNRPAVECFGRAISLKPDYAAAYYNRGQAYLKEAQYELAIGDFTWAIEEEPDNPIHYPLRGKALFLRRRYDEAMADYGRAIELNPADRSAYEGRAEVYERRGDKQRAEQDRRQARLLGGAAR